MSYDRIAPRICKYLLFFNLISLLQECSSGKHDGSFPICMCIVYLVKLFLLNDVIIGRLKQFLFGVY